MIRRPRAITFALPAILVALALAAPLGQSLALFTDSQTIGSNSLTSGSWNTANYSTFYLHDNPTPPTGDTTTTVAANATSTRTRTAYVVVSAPTAPTANFGASPLKLNGCSGTVNFTDASTGNPTSWAWDFKNDGTATSAAQNPSYTYTACGTYTVKLTAANGSGSNVVTRSALIELRSTALSPTTYASTHTAVLNGGWSSPSNAFVDDSQVAEASPATNGVTVSGDFGVTFGAAAIPTDATITRVEAQVAWERSNSSGTLGLQLYNDGTPMGTETTAQPPTKTKVTAIQFVTSGFSRTDLIGGNLKSRVRCSRDGGGVTCDLYYVRVQVTFTVPAIAAAPTASFTASPTSHELGTSVTFTNASSGTIDRWIWDFDDDGKVDSVSSSAANPIYTYASPGTYTAKLTVTGEGGTNTQTRTSYVTVSIPAVPGASNTAEFYGTPIRGTTSLVVAFADRSSGTPTAWAWDFGDGTLSTSQNPSKTYTVVGTYTVTLTATYSTGGGSTQKQLSMDTTSPTATTLYKYSTDVDGAAPGRAVRRGGINQSESRAGYSVAWKTGLLGSSRSISGNVLLATWGTLASYGSGKGVVTVYLRDYNPAAGTYAEIADQTLTRASWNAGAGSFYQRDFAIRVSSYTVPAGHQLEVKLIVGSVSDADMWFAYDTTAYPAYVRLP